MNWNPNKWLAALLGFFFQSVAFLYVGRWRLAMAFFAATIALAVLEAKFRGSTLSLLAMSVIASISAYRIASKTAPVGKRPWFGRWYGILGVVGTVVALTIIVRVFVMEPFRIPSTAMSPTIDAGAIVLANKIGYGTFGAYGVVLTRHAPYASVPRGALVVFESPSRPGVIFLKRVVALPGDALVYKNKYLMINGKRMTQGEERLDAMRTLVRERIDGTVYTTIHDSQGPPAVDLELTVAPDHYFLMGDNRDASHDSRHYGAVSGELLIGEVTYVLLAGQAEWIK